MSMSSPTYPQIYSAASDVISTLEKLNVQPAFVGSMACKLNGNQRWPNDLDVLCQNWSGTQEELKRRLVATNSKFYLVASRNPRANYKVLWYRIAIRTSVKVDILLPGTMDLCPVPVESIELRNGLPCVPMPHLILYKLQGWIHHGESRRNMDKLKMPADVSDIKGLLETAVRRKIRLFEEPYFDPMFISNSKFRISKFVFQYVETRSQWRDIGYIP